MGRGRVRWIAGVSGAVFAVCVAVFAWQLSVVAGENPGLRNVEPLVGVLTCTTAIEAGDRITDLNVGVTAFPKSLVPAGAVVEADLDKVRGRRAGATMGRGEIVTDRRLTRAVSPLDSLRPGHTAITVAVDPVRALGGEATPGMRVDLMVDEAIGSVSAVAPGVRILSTSVRVAPADSSSLVPASSSSSPDITWITLEVPDELVPAVVTASGEGSVYLVLPAVGNESGRG